jgi:uncharacterized protein YegP (UPF0339 family)
MNDLTSGPVDIAAPSYSDVHFELYPVRRKSGREWRWRLRAKNGKIVAEGGESFVNRSDCIASIQIVMRVDDETPIQRI